MANLFDRVGNVRNRLRHPRANRPGDGDCLRAICDHTKILRAKRKNTGNPWDLGDKRITVRSDLARYPINDLRFGSPLAVLTIDDANPNHYQQIIPWYCPQNLAVNWGLPNNIATWNVNFDGSTHSAERVAFYWSGGVPYLEFQPIPKAPATYLVRFLVGNSVDAMGLADPLAMGEIGDTLVEVRAAISMLSFSDYEDDRKVNKEIREDIGTTLDFDEKLFAAQYDADTQVHTQSSIGQMWSPE